MSEMRVRYREIQLSMIESQDILIKNAKAHLTSIIDRQRSLKQAIEERSILIPEELQRRSWILERDLDKLNGLLHTINTQQLFLLELCSGVHTTPSIWRERTPRRHRRRLTVEEESKEIEKAQKLLVSVAWKLVFLTTVLIVALVHVFKRFF